LSEPSRALLIDFGSTFTKVRAVDLDEGVLLASAQAQSTVGTHIMEGLENALEAIRRAVPEAGAFDGWLKLASSSAAGGLRIVAVGLIQDLTAEAARRAALGAGGKIVATFANGLTARDATRIEELAPDLIVLAGGTDGGNQESLVGNGRALASSALVCPIILAGNRYVADEVGDELKAAGKNVVVVENVLPTLSTLNIDPCSRAIRDVFMERIVESKGLLEAEQFVEQILMPTPHAVLLGCQLLAEGSGSAPGMGELLCIDVGGATTDVYSIASGAPSSDKVSVHGLPEPYVKRTVEGDLGLRVNARSIVDAVGSEALGRDLGIEASLVSERADSLGDNTETLPESEEDAAFDVALARSAVSVAARRHAGSIEIAYGPRGKFYVQTGKDLRPVKTLVGTGGIFASSPRSDADAALSAAAQASEEGGALLPETAARYVDADYVLYAAGLLSERAPEAAVRMLRASVVPLEAPANVAA
jgi:uncharacterized protein (TIGR01319 family)